MTDTPALRPAFLTVVLPLVTFAVASPAAPQQATPAKATAKIEIADSVAAPAPRLVHKTNPVYPADARAEKVEGLIVIDVVIGRDGVIREARVVASAPNAERLKEVMPKKGTPEAALGDARLAAAALDAVKTWQYEPVVKDGQAVEARATVTVNFKLS